MYRMVIVETKRYVPNTFIENVIIDKFNKCITPYTKVYDILEIIFEHTTTSNLDKIKPNSLGYVYIYNDFIYENLYICQKTYFDIGRLLKYNSYDISIIIQEYLYHNKKIDIDVTMDDENRCCDMEDLVNIYIDKYRADKRIIDNQYITDKNGTRHAIYIIDESIVDEIELHVDFLMLKSNDYVVVNDISNIKQIKKELYEMWHN